MALLDGIPRPDMASVASGAAGWGTFGAILGVFVCRDLESYLAYVAKFATVGAVVNGICTLHVPEKEHQYEYRTSRG